MQKKMNSKSLDYEDVLYFDLQPHTHGVYPRVSSYRMKQTLQGSYIWKMNTFRWLTDVIQTFH